MAVRTSFAAALTVSLGLVRPLTALKSQVSRVKGGACDCLEWKDVYAKHNVECGQGLELTWAGGISAKPDVGDQFCSDFYERLHGNSCFNNNFSSDVPQQWCYVGKECADVLGSARVTLVANTTVGHKFCEDQGDDLMSTHLPLALEEYKEKANVDACTLAMMSYPQLQAFAWPDVKNFFLPGVESARYEAPESKDPVNRARFQKMKDSGKPWIIGSKTGKPPFAVVAGEKVFETVARNTFLEKMYTWKVKLQDQAQINDFLCQNC